MNKIKAKTLISNTVRQEIIDKFSSDVKDYIDHLKDFKRESIVMLFVGSTSDTTNKNGRIIDGNYVESNIQNYIGTPIKFDHAISQSSILGNVFYGYAQKDDIQERKYTVLAGVVDNYEGMTNAKLNKFTRLNFSASYATLGSDTICPSCKRNTTKFFNIYTKELECQNCTHSFGKEYDSTKLTVRPHARVYKRYGKSKEMSISWSPEDLKKSHDIQNLDKKDKEKNAYFMLMQNHKIAEISIVETPADALDAPLIAFSTVGALLDSLETNDSFVFGDPINKIEYDADILNNDNIIDINTYSNGEQPMLNDTLHNLLVTLGKKYPDSIDTVLADYLTSDDAIKAMKDELTDAVAIKYIDRIFGHTFEKLEQHKTKVTELEDSIKKMTDELVLLKSSDDKLANQEQNDGIQKKSDSDSTQSEGTIVVQKPTGGINTRDSITASSKKKFRKTT